MDKADLSERDICTQYITPSLQQAGWDLRTQVREEVTFTKGRIIVRGRQVNRGERKRADYVLYYKPNLPIAVIEAKDNAHSIGAGMQQGLGYAETLDIPFVFSSNGDAFLEHDRTVPAGPVERELALDAFPSPDALWARYCAWKGLSAPAQQLVTQDYYSDGSGRAPRYYQLTAIVTHRVILHIDRRQ
jgi:type I restriction enzyme, R subunit